MNLNSHTGTSVSSLREANDLQSQVEHDHERVQAAALVAVWLLVPVALGAVSYFLLGIILLLSERLSEDAGDLEYRVSSLQWLILTLLLQAAYWCWLSQPWQKGLWALIPIVGLIPTFAIARTVLRNEQKLDSRHTLPENDPST